jgi:hypothetical protein
MILEDHKKEKENSPGWIETSTHEAAQLCVVGLRHQHDQTLHATTTQETKQDRNSTLSNK